MGVRKVSLALRLHSAIAAVCPIDGVSIPDPEDRNTWRINFAASALEAQRQAAEAIKAAFKLLPSIGDLVEKTRCGGTVILDPGEYDDPTPVEIDNKRITIVGPREAIVHSEFTIYNSYVVFVGFTMEMNKVGAPQHTGKVWPDYPQNGMVTALNSQFWSDDVLWNSFKPPGWNGETIFSKCAIHSVNGFTRVSAVNSNAPIDWRGNDAAVIEHLYGGVLYLIDNTHRDLTVGIQPGTSEANGAAVSIVNGDCVMSGAHIYDSGTTPYGVSVARDGFLQVGAGLYTTINKPFPVALDATGSRKWVAPGSIG